MAGGLHQRSLHQLEQRAHGKTNHRNLQRQSAWKPRKHLSRTWVLPHGKRRHIDHMIPLSRKCGTFPVPCCAAPICDTKGELGRTLFNANGGPNTVWCGIRRMLIVASKQRFAPLSSTFLHRLHAAPAIARSALEQVRSALLFLPKATTVGLSSAPHPSTCRFDYPCIIWIVSSVIVFIVVTLRALA
jgi:hypothetical protein